MYTVMSQNIMNTPYTPYTGSTTGGYTYHSNGFVLNDTIITPEKLALNLAKYSTITGEMKKMVDKMLDIVLTGNTNSNAYVIAISTLKANNFLDEMEVIQRQAKISTINE